MKYIITTISFLWILNMGYGQTKFEKESRISIDLVPNNAKVFVLELAPSKKIKWYKEESQKGKSIEAKTCYQNKKYSIEFNLDGTLQDIEIETTLKAINTKAKAKLTNYLESRFKSYKTKKIQVQYTGSNQDLLHYFKTGNNQNITTKYEIVLKGKTDTSKHLYEFTFSEDGSFESQKKIVFRNTDNIEF